MKLTARLLDIADRGVLLNTADARNLGVLHGDRVQILNESSGISTAACVDTTATLVPEGTVGIYRICNDKLCVTDGIPLEVREAARPQSLEYITKKMNGERLTKEETHAIIKDVVSDDLSSAELTAYITASYINALDMDEIEHLTRAMVDTGEHLNFHSHPIVDKHSIGGVPGNKISLIVVPIIAASGLKIPKTSSRAITGAGGTADLMEILAPVAFSATEVQRMTLKVGGTIVWGGATNIAPADDKIIVQEYPFKIDARGQMLASVMAKKLAIGADLVVIDIPVGPNTKVANLQEGRKLARDFIEIGDRLKIRVECAVTYGGSPVGRAIGPNLEVVEALKALEGNGQPSSLIQKSLAIAGIALEMSGKAAPGNGSNVAGEILRSGKALEKLRQIIEIQGGDPKVKSSDIVPGKHEFVVKSQTTGYVTDFNNRSLITIARLAGAPHNTAAGVLLHAKKGNKVQAGDPIFTIYAERKWQLDKAVEEGRRLMPVVVEGMLIDRVPGDYKWQ